MVEDVIGRRERLLAHGKLIVGLLLLGLVAAASAATLPTPDAIETAGGRPVTLTVVEPHESLPGHRVEVAYRAFPAPIVLAAALGPDWAAKAEAIEFRALDGYVSHIDVARLKSGRAFLAFARADGRPFEVDNLGQNERHIPLGPYYLIWDNRRDPALLDAGARDWPYQAADVVFADAALRPPGFDSELDNGLSAAKANCLTCHQVNGWGGDKVAGDLALMARQMTKADLIRRALDPSAVDPKSTMPPLMPGAPEAARRAAAEAIFAYLVRVAAAGQ